MKKFLALFDLHFGFEFKNGIKTPTHNIKLVRAVQKFYKDFKPDVLILGGDQLNCGPISHWHHGKPRLTRDLKLKDEIDLLKKEIIEPFYSCPEKIWMDGNHEAWISQFLDEHPSLEGMIEPLNSINSLNAKYAQGEIYKLGKLHFAHGDTLLGKGNYINPAQILINKTRVNIRVGHLHTYFAATDFNPLKSNDYHTAIVVPCMCNTNPAYVKNAPSKILNGFLYGYVYPDGNFSDYVVVAHNNKFVVNGVKYE